jgi:predicted kinase
VADHEGAAVRDDVAGDGNAVGPQAPVWIVAGAPGAGKSTVAALLAARLSPHPAVLDKDTVYGPFVVAVLEAAGREPGEREGDWYDRNAKAHEYQGLTATAREVRGHGCPVLLVAPFTGQIRDPGAWTEWNEQLGGGEVRLVWVSCDPAVLRERLIARGSDRDGAKLAAYAQFVARMRPDEPPPVPHFAVHNTDSSPVRLVEQIEGLVRMTANGVSA